jgi:5-formyltetrahydrofolate cyclo-ligase
MQPKEQDNKHEGNIDEKLKEKKKLLRKEILAKRSAMTADEVLKQSRRICENVICSKFYKSCKKLCLYMPIRNEVDVRLLLEAAWDDGKQVYLPKVLPDDYMEFYSYNESTALISGAYNILEPDSKEILVPDSDTLIIMPGAVFSKDNKRIGYGGGYYDRYLAKHPECKTIAVAYDFQILEHIPYEEHDVCPDVVINCTQPAK